MRDIVALKATAKSPRADVIAWCRVAVDGVGFDRITFTTPDGLTRLDLASDDVFMEQATHWFSFRQRESDG